MDTVDSMELLGTQIDTINNLLAALEMPLPPALHVAGLKPNLKEVSAKLREVYIAVTGDDPWADHPTADQGQKT